MTNETHHFQASTVLKITTNYNRTEFIYALVVVAVDNWLLQSSILFDYFCQTIILPISHTHSAPPQCIRLCILCVTVSKKAKKKMFLICESLIICCRRLTLIISKVFFTKLFTDMPKNSQNQFWSK